MLRRDFLHRSSRAAAGALLASSAVAKRLAAIPFLPRKFSGSDTVTLGNTGIQTSRLAMGTGTVGSGHHSHQTALGMDGLPRLLSMATTTVSAFSTPPTLMAAILMYPKLSST